MKYFGPRDILRASYREVAEELSKPHWKTLSHRKRLAVKVGEAMRLEIEIWPTGMLFEPGEQLVVKISGQFMGPTEFETLQGTFPVRNEGQHTISWGGAICKLHRVSDCEDCGRHEYLTQVTPKHHTICDISGQHINKEKIFSLRFSV